MDGLDWGTYYFFRNQRGAGAVNLNPVMLLGMELGGCLALAILGLGIVLLLWRRNGFREVAIFTVVLICGVVLDQVLKALVRRPPPPDAELWLERTPMPFSFPNTAALFSCLLLLVLAKSLKPQGSPRAGRFIYGLCGAAILFIGVSQLFLGLSFVTDLLAGWTIAVILALVFAHSLFPCS